LIGQIPCAPYVEALLALLVHHREGGLHPFVRRLQLAFVDRLSAAPTGTTLQQRQIISRSWQRALASNAQLWTSEQLEAEVALLRHHRLDVDVEGKSLMWYLIDADRTLWLRWWIEKYGRHSDWLWPPLVREEPAEEGGLPHFRFTSHLSVVEYAVDNFCNSCALGNANIHATVKSMTLSKAAEEWCSIGLPALRREVEAVMIPDLAAIVMRMLAPPSAEQVRAEIAMDRVKREAK
jgi:hypothetical protein